jgi:hypothetical protein
VIAPVIHEGCTNIAIKGGVCKRHGAKKEHKHKRCSVKGCTNQVQKGGVCIKHGAKVKSCSVEGCTNQSQRRRLCVKHGTKAERKRCSSKGCTSLAQMEEFVLSTEQRSNDAAFKDAPIKFEKEECA